MNINSIEELNITDFADRQIFARFQGNGNNAIYYFKTEDDSHLEVVNFDLHGGAVTQTATIPREWFNSHGELRYFHNGSATSTAPCSGF